MTTQSITPIWAHDYSVKSLINIKFTQSIPGNSSIRHLSDRDILARIERAKDSNKREKESPIGVPASLIREVHKGLIDELNERKA